MGHPRRSLVLVAVSGTRPCGWSAGRTGTRSSPAGCTACPAVRRRPARDGPRPPHPHRHQPPRVSHDQDWYEVEARTLHELNVSQEDVTLSANRLPPPAELRRLIDVLDHTEYPIVFHCKQGADRTGLTAAVVLLLYTDATLVRRERQLWPRYGHFRFGRTAAIDEFFDLYEAWLTAEGAEHSPERFRHWALTVYTPGPARSELTWLDAPPGPVPAKDKPLALRVRATNRSIEPWELKPGELRRAST